MGSAITIGYVLVISQKINFIYGSLYLAHSDTFLVKFVIVTTSKIGFSWIDFCEKSDAFLESIVDISFFGLQF